MARFIFYLCILAIFNYSCYSRKCTVDPKFVDNFNKKLKLIQLEEQKKDSVNIEKYRYALIYFSTITEILPRADYSSTVGYRNRQYYEEDMKKLKAWLKHNKCNFTIGKSDSILRAVGYSMLISE